MREIKFRGKQSFDNKWIHGSLLKDKEKYYITNDYGDTFYAVIPQTIGQYTGLKDKHNVPIYEGDIVIYEWINMEKFKVIYDEEDALFSLEPLDIGRKDIWNIGFFKSNMKNHTLEVIGNIYDKGE